MEEEKAMHATETTPQRVSEQEPQMKGVRRKSKQQDKEAAKTPTSFIVKVVFGERSKFLSSQPRTLQDLKLQTAISFGIILPSQYNESSEDINPEELSRAATKKQVEFT